MRFLTAAGSRSACLHRTTYHCSWFPLLFPATAACIPHNTTAPLCLISSSCDLGFLWITGWFLVTGVAYYRTLPPPLPAYTWYPASAPLPAATTAHQLPPHRLRGAFLILGWRWASATGYRSSCLLRRCLWANTTAGTTAVGLHLLACTVLPPATALLYGFSVLSPGCLPHRLPHASPFTAAALLRHRFTWVCNILPPPPDGPSPAYTVIWRFSFKTCTDLWIPLRFCGTTTYLPHTIWVYCHCTTFCAIIPFCDSTSPRFSRGPADSPAAHHRPTVYLPRFGFTILRLPFLGGALPTRRVFLLFFLPFSTCLQDCAGVLPFYRLPLLPRSPHTSGFTLRFAYRTCRISAILPRLPAPWFLTPAAILPGLPHLRYSDSFCSCHTAIPPAAILPPPAGCFSASHLTVGSHMSPLGPNRCSTPTATTIPAVLACTCRSCSAPRSILLRIGWAFLFSGFWSFSLPHYTDSP